MTFSDALLTSLAARRPTEDELLAYDRFDSKNVAYIDRLIEEVDGDDQK